MEALVMAGILISFAGSSRPASGSEHHLSDFFEITGIVNGTPYLPHGLDVAFSTVITGRIREQLCARPFPQTMARPVPGIPEQELRRVYTAVADSCMELQEKVGNYAADRSAVYLQKQAQIKQILAEVPSGKEIRDMLALVQLDMDTFYDLYGKAHIADAVRYAKDLKDRYTVLWIWYDLFGGESADIV